MNLSTTVVLLIESKEVWVMALTSPLDDERTEHIERQTTDCGIWSRAGRGSLRLPYSCY